MKSVCHILWKRRNQDDVDFRIKLAQLFCQLGSERVLKLYVKNSDIACLRTIMQNFLA